MGGESPSLPVLCWETSLGRGRSKWLLLGRETEAQKKEEEMKKSFRRTEEVSLEITSRKRKKGEKNERKTFFNMKREEEG